ncbi:MAG: ABC transporter substrate-binding protein [Pirellulales bacterium]|nr:ABC transporter substrate-binding protein [Pirellulales bacterium]
MRIKLILTTIIVLIFVVSFWARSRLLAPAANVRTAGPPQRIISMAPSLTEMLFALGLGDRVVGVTRYCNYPPEVKAIPPVGGLADPNLEAMAALEPDLVLMVASGKRWQPALNTLRIPTLVVDHRDVDGILASITTIGQACGAEEQAAALLDDMQARLARIKRRTAHLTPPRVLMVVDRTGRGAGRLQDMHTAGNHPYFNAIIEMAGGRNVMKDAAVTIPLITVEGILGADPDVIFDLVPPASDQSPSQDTLRADWDPLLQLDPAAGRRVFVLDDPYAQIPGPRFILLVEKMARLLHPELARE